MSSSPQSWEILRNRALDYRESAQILEREFKFQNAIEQAHLSVEILMKAVIDQAGGKFPEIHFLEKLAHVKVRKGRKTHKPVWTQLRRHKYAQEAFARVCSAWGMHLRYKQMVLDPLDYGEILSDFEQVYECIDRILTEI